MSYFREVLADFDEERVYPSDVKKILNWYNTLQAKGLVVTTEVTNAEVAEEAVAVVAEKPKKVKKSKE
jgi:hypothetical protein